MPPGCSPWRRSSSTGEPRPKRRARSARGDQRSGPATPRPSRACGHSGGTPGRARSAAPGLRGYASRSSRGDALCRSEHFLRYSKQDSHTRVEPRRRRPSVRVSRREQDPVQVVGADAELLSEPLEPPPLLCENASYGMLHAVQATLAYSTCSVKWVLDFPASGAYCASCTTCNTSTSGLTANSPRRAGRLLILRGPVSTRLIRAGSTLA